MRASVTEEVQKKGRRQNVNYPFTNRDLRLQIWSTDAKQFPGKQYVIGQDLGLSEPIKSPADALFSRGFMRIGTKVLPLMLSGSGWTQAVYSVFHNYYADKIRPTDQILALGDDINLLTDVTTDEVFTPYKKVKSTNAEQNTKKILGMYSAFSIKPDPMGDEMATIGVVPRVIKTISSASKRSTDWSESLSDLPDSGELMLKHSDRVEQTMAAELGMIKNYLLWQGERKELRAKLQSLWGSVQTSIWKALLRHDPDLVYKVGEAESPETEAPEIE
jgi:hypothetical protein